MKQGWQTKNLGDLCEIELGKTPARANASLWDEKRETSNVWLSIADLLKTEDNVVVDSKEYVSDKGAGICKLVPKGTLLVSFKLTLGRLAFAGRDLFTNEAIAALTIFNERELSKEFLFYCLTFFDWVKAAENDVKLKGMTLNKAKLKVMSVSFPPLAEQQRIVGLLDEAFEGLATAKANAEKNLQNARALFESHLQSVFTQRGPGWVTKTFGEVLEIRNGRNQLEVESPDGEFPIYGSAGKVMGMATDYICEAGTTIIGRKGNINSPIYADTRFWNVDTAFGLASKAGMDSRFLYFFCLSYDFSAHNRGTTIPSLVKSELLNIPIPVPPPAEQQRIVGLLDSLQEETQRLARFYERKHAALEALKKSLLHQAFTGAL